VQVWFIYKEPWGHVDIRGHQVASELNSRDGIEAHVIHISEFLLLIRNKSLGIVKKGSVAVLLREVCSNHNTYTEIWDHGCKIVIDIIDLSRPASAKWRFFKRYPLINKPAHAIIFPNKFYLNNIKHCLPIPETKYKCIYHHIDRRLIPNTNQEKINFYAFNKNEIYDLIGERIKLKVFESSDTFRNDWGSTFLKNYNCYLSLRGALESEESISGLIWYFLKSNVRLSVAAGTDSVIIANRECAYEELLPPDYPYWVGSNACSHADPIHPRGVTFTINEILDAIHYAEETFNKQEWNIAKDMIRSLKPKLSLQTISEEYLTLFRYL